MYPHFRRFSGRWPSLLLVASLAPFLAATLFLAGTAQAENVVLKNGMRLQGNIGKIPSLASASLSATKNDVPRIIFVDDDMRRVFFNQYQLAGVPTPSAAAPNVRIKILQRVATSGQMIASVGATVKVEPFDEWGRRTYIMSGEKGTVPIVQGITEITPTHTTVEALQGGMNLVWSTRIATSSIPRKKLSEILHHHINMANADERLQIVRLYIQADRVQEAREELDGMIKDFPGLEHLNDQVKKLHQMGAQRLLKEIELRRESGQHQLALTMLQAFPDDGVSGETLLKVRDILGEYMAQTAQAQKILGEMEKDVGEIEGDDKTKGDLSAIVAEMKGELNFSTLNRMEDYGRLADDDKLKAEQRLAVAISSWILGGGSASENLAVSRSLIKVRQIVQAYLVSKHPPERARLLAELRDLEGSSPDNVAKILANMKPPLTSTIVPQGTNLPEAKPDENSLITEEKAAAKPADKDAPKAPAGKEARLPINPAQPTILAQAPALPPATATKEDKSAARPKDALVDDDLVTPGSSPKPKAKAKPVVAEKPREKNTEKKEKDQPDAPAKPAVSSDPAVEFHPSIPGLYEITVKGLPEDPMMKYLVQVPPEYEPYRKYPLIVSLHGVATSPLLQIDFWAGLYNPKMNMRLGHATRNGYIVIAPAWTNEHQRKYEFTAREHAAVLLSLRDCFKRFSVDTDRVFLTGHSAGADAAWDVALSHPDLWAGVLPIVGTADKYISKYWENAELVPFYFVSGEKDGARLAANGNDWDRYLTRTKNYDCMIVQYLGRGHESYNDELLNMFDWMGLHKRNFYPREFETVALRPWDNFYWYAELTQMPPGNTVLPAAWPPSGTLPVQTKFRLLPPASNGLTITSAAKKMVVWLSPEMIDFKRKAIIRINDKQLPGTITPNTTDMLEDARSRADRQHPFWAKVATP